MSNHVVTRAVLGVGGQAGRGRTVELGALTVVAGLAVLAATRPGSHGGQPAAVLIDLSRTVGYAGVTLFIGTVVFWLLIWPSGHRERGLILLAWLGLILTTLSAGAGLVSTLVVDVDALLDRPAASLLARLLLVAAAVPWLARYVTDRAATHSSGVLLVLALALTVVTARPGALPLPTIALTELHVLAAACWVGGLAALAVAVVPRRDPSVLHATLGGFSWLSMSCVATLAITGILHALLRAGGLQPLIESEYGAALLAKLLAVGGMLTAATGSHTYVRRLGSQAAPVQVIGLFIGAELALGAAAIVLTAALASAPV
ncbi:CopD family protein [Kribbella sp. NPDC050124]|uniref:CopD family protein n=1 Tax=Kribbella sp. NPDC050124 TaxID=3364114 RepID=UPI0037B3633C